MEIARKLKELRKDKDLKQKDVAEAINIAQSTLANYESGASLPDYPILIKLANFYNTSIDYLLDNSPTRLSWKDADKNIELCNNDFSLLKLAEIIKSLDIEDREALIHIAIGLYNQSKYKKPDRKRIIKP